MATRSSNVVIVDAVRTTVGRRNGGLSSLHPAEVLGLVQKGIVDRTGIDPAQIEQVVGGCVSQVGEQAFNVTRTAWLAAGLPLTEVGVVTAGTGVALLGDEAGTLRAGAHDHFQHDIP